MKEYQNSGASEFLLAKFNVTQVTKLLSNMILADVEEINRSAIEAEEDKPIIYINY